MISCGRMNRFLYFRFVIDRESALTGHIYIQFYSLIILYSRYIASNTVLDTVLYAEFTQS